MNNQSSNNSVYDTTIRLFILMLIVAWCLLIMYPFVNVILWSLILAFAMYPLHNRLVKKLRGKRKLASFIIIFAILAIIILPAGLLINALIDEVKELKVSYDNGMLSIPQPSENVKTWPVIGEKIFDTWQNASVDLKQHIITNKDQLIEVGRKIATGILSAAGGVLQIIVSLFFAGILLTFGGAGEAIRKFFRKVGGNRGDELADLTIKTVGSVVKGIIGEGLVLALLHCIVFILAGVPYVGIWTLLVFVCAICQIPVFFITLPVMIYFFAMKEIVPAVLWTISLVLVSLSDNILTPLMLGKGAPVPMIVIFIGVIGGFIFSGFIGLFTGAIVMSVGYKLFIGWINSSNESNQNG